MLRRTGGRDVRQDRDGADGRGHCTVVQRGMGLPGGLRRRAGVIMLHLRSELRAIRASLAPATRTARACDWSRVRIALRAASQAKRRVRVYSGAGFVPNSYRWRCQIQYVELTVAGGRITSVYTGWTGAQRANAAGSLIVVQ